MSEQSFKMISSFYSYSSFFTLCIFGHNLQTHTPIQLKHGKHKGLIKAHLHTNFGWNLIKIYRVMIDFSHKNGRRPVTPTG